MTDTSVITPEFLRKLIRYEPSSGKYFWIARDPSLFTPTKKRSQIALATWWNSRFADKETFICVNNRGYLTTRIFGHCMLAHRAIWAIHYGAWPTLDLDHINRDRADNRLENLREATPSQNARNKSLASNNKSGVRGVYQDSEYGGWRANIYTNEKKQIYLGAFKTREEAIAARRAAEIELGY